MTVQLLVTRDVGCRERHNCADRAVKAGETFYLYEGNTYGCIDRDGGIPVSLAEDEGPFFEFPSDAVKRSQ